MTVKISAPIKQHPRDGPDGLQIERKTSPMPSSLRQSPFPYFALVFLLSIPFWLAGFIVTELPIPINLPISALMAFMPMFAALILVYRENGVDGVKALLKRIVDYRKTGSGAWVLVAMSFMPVALGIAWAAMWLTGAPLPEFHIALGALPIFFAMFFIAGIGEELGWQGYIFDRMQTRWNALEASLVLGAVWTLWHLIPYIQTRHSAEWIAWHCGVTLLLRVVTVWLYLNAGRSVFVAVVFHAMSNVAYYLFPNYGSHYDPFYFFCILAPIVIAIVLMWGPTLTRFGFRRAPDL